MGEGPRSVMTMNDTARDIIRNNYRATRVRVTYEDMANAYSIGTVIGHRGDQFHIQWDDSDDGECWSDLRQRGWRPVPFTAAVPA